MYFIRPVLGDLKWGSDLHNQPVIYGIIYTVKKKSLQNGVRSNGFRNSENVAVFRAIMFNLRLIKIASLDSHESTK